MLLRIRLIDLSTWNNLTKPKESKVKLITYPYVLYLCLAYWTVYIDYLFHAALFSQLLNVRWDDLDGWKYFLWATTDFWNVSSIQTSMPKCLWKPFNSRDVLDAVCKRDGNWCLTGDIILIWNVTFVEVDQRISKLWQRGSVQLRFLSKIRQALDYR